MRLLRAGLVMFVLVGCSKKSSEPASTGSAASAPTAAPAKPPDKEAAGPGGEVFHTLDKTQVESFSARQLAVGGGHVYWIHKPRIDKNGLGKSTVETKPVTGGEVQTVAPASTILAVAADGDALYWAASNGVFARPHAGGDPKQLAKGAYFEIVPGASYLIVRNDKEVALVPKAGGGAERIAEVTRGDQVHLASDGDRFYVVEASGGKTGTLTAYEHGKPPQKLVDGTALGDVGVSGPHVYFGGPGTSSVFPSLFRIAKDGSGTPEQVGDPAWGFSDFVIANGALYGMVLTGTWSLQKLPLDGGAQPTVLDRLKGFGSMVPALAAGDTHLYYVTRVDVNRVPL